MDPGLENQLIVAIRSDNVSRFKELMTESGTDINHSLNWLNSRSLYQQRTPLMIAATWGCLKVVKYILKSDELQLNETSATDGLTALDCACMEENTNSQEIYDLLVTSSAVPSNEVLQILHETSLASMPRFPPPAPSLYPTPHGTATIPRPPSSTGPSQNITPSPTFAGPSQNIRPPQRIGTMPQHPRPNQNTIRERKIQTKQLRDNARARARARTREKLMIRQLESSGRQNI